MTGPQAAAIFVIAFLAAVSLGASPPRLAGVALEPIQVRPLRVVPITIPRGLCPGWVFQPDLPRTEANMRCINEVSR